MSRWLGVQFLPCFLTLHVTLLMNAVRQPTTQPTRRRKTNTSAILSTLKIAWALINIVPQSYSLLPIHLVPSITCSETDQVNSASCVNRIGRWRACFQQRKALLREAGLTSACFLPETMWPRGLSRDMCLRRDLLDISIRLTSQPMSNYLST